MDLSASDAIALPDTVYQVSVTNTGPQPLESATVVVRLDPRIWRIDTTTCAADVVAATMTCTFADVAVGATVSKTGRVQLLPGPSDRTTFLATASRESSSPADPNGANDSASVRCVWTQGFPGVPGWPRGLVCREVSS